MTKTHLSPIPPLTIALVYAPADSTSIHVIDMVQQKLLDQGDLLITQ